MAEVRMKTPDLTVDPMVQAAAELNRAKRTSISLRKKLLLLMPLPIGGYFLVGGLTLTGTHSGDPLTDLTNGLLRSLFFLGALSMLFVSLRALVAILRK
jgi:hypothetical protein